VDSTGEKEQTEDPQIQAATACSHCLSVGMAWGMSKMDKNW